MAGFPEVVIIGAGPYGLSLAAHLRHRGVEFRIFGRAMTFWETQMPQGMLLKSDGYASNISEPAGSFRLRDFCAEQHLSYADEGIPVSLDNFVAYGHAFQQRLVPELDKRLVLALTRTPAGFRLQLDDGELITAAQVVIAVGIGYFPYIPPLFHNLPPAMLTHSSQHHDMTPLIGKQVCVLGGGASAIDTAALLHEAGATTRLVARQICFHDRTPLKGRSLWQRIIRPNSGIGAGWRPAIYATAPLLFRALPEQKRRHITKYGNGPAGGWMMQDRVLGKVPMLVGYEPQRAWVDGGQVHLRLAHRDSGTIREIAADHLISATGYQADLRQLHFLDQTLRLQICAVDNTPVLSANFETSVTGLYFVGAIARLTFGPLLRFVYGTEFASRQTVRRIAATASRRRLVSGHAAELHPASGMATRPESAGRMAQ